MKTQRTEQIYKARVARVIGAIAADPMAEHRLEDLARLAHCSPFHFHRIYNSMTGETVTATVRRMRLALATRLLTAGNRSITQVGQEVGYDSPQAFTRAFGQFAGQSPSVFQHQMHRVILDADACARNGDASAGLAVRVVERPAQRVYALRHQGPLSTIPHTQRLLRRHAGARYVSDWLGVSCGDPEDAGSFSYYAAAASPEIWPVETEPETALDMLDIPASVCPTPSCRCAGKSPKRNSRRRPYPTRASKRR